MSAVSASPPAVSDVVRLVRGLFALGVSEKEVAERPCCSIAEYVNDAGEVAGHIACDLETGCRLAAALTQIPAGRVDEAIGEGSLSENLRENLDEIFNICVNLLTSGDGGRLVLNRVVHGTEHPDIADVQSALSPQQKIRCGFTLDRYGDCCLCVSC